MILNILEFYLITVLSLYQIEVITIPVKKEEVGKVKKIPYVKEVVIKEKPITETKGITYGTTSGRIDTQDI